MATVNESLCGRTGMLMCCSVTQKISNYTKFQPLFSLEGLMYPLPFNPIALQNEREINLGMQGSVAWQRYG